MTNFTSILHLFLLSCTTCTINAFQTSQMLPVRIDPISKQEISQRLGLKHETDNNAVPMLSIGSGPNMAYYLMNEHEVVCPVSGAHQGILCTAILPQSIYENENDAESIVNNHELVSQAILAGSLAASIRNRCKDGNSIYYLPFVITLVESLMADEMESINLEEMVFNSGGLETNEILSDFGDDELMSGEERRSVMLYATNTLADQTSATSDVYLFPPEKKGKVWRFSVDYKVATINLRSIPSFGDRDSTTPLRPDVWLKDDSY